MKKLFILLFALVAFVSSAQVFDFKSIYSLTSDTVTNSGTVYLTSPSVSAAPATSTTIWIQVTKISGTVDGNLTLLGSLDGTNFLSVIKADTVESIGVIDTADASAHYHFRLSGSPYKYYRVSWTGTGTMSASFTAKLFRGK